jgi:hypothetical protein
MFEVVYECWLMLEKGMSAGACSKKAICAESCLK